MEKGNGKIYFNYRMLINTPQSLLVSQFCPPCLHLELQEYKNKKRRESFNFLRFSSETRD